mmetsp:Transcript_7973/g.21126  ORF Transcript_7973/g.21126 Transcript_7973/m.21126 type:complete len:260 (+) Transcript_7973:201-980(+)|eukprot:CAMPEP_0185839184 /NCGR_PEP_ID=MMETSP1353-20130828/14190_1 /TAXON_ID=1077150 /ORGANISM="Erythrolobus australicus, Strain CCMP3124" /LENGTH=259 /DNA_ID=CAMNT_0028538309 /DNA_START=131 /DNA_END=910 /DNA_ORIENTATION=+
MSEEEIDRSRPDWAERELMTLASGAQEVDEEYARVAQITGWRKYFRKTLPGEVIEPPPKELREVTLQTLYGVAGGIGYGLYRGVQDTKIASIKAPAELNVWHKRMRYFMVLRSTRYGALAGLFCGLYTASRLSIGHWRETDDAWNAVGAGAVVGTLFGLRLSRGAPGALSAGAAVAASIGSATALQQYLVAQIPEEDRLAAEEDAEYKRKLDDGFSVEEMMPAVRSAVAKIRARAIIGLKIADDATNPNSQEPPVDKQS